MDNQNYPPIMHWLAGAPGVCFFLVYLLNTGDLGYGSFGIMLGIVSLMVFVGLIVAYVNQWRFLRQGFAPRLKWQAIFILAASCVPALAAVLGDLAGRAEFGSSGVLSDSFLTGGLIAAAILGIGALYISALGNVFFIISGGRVDALKILGIIVRILFSAFVLFIAYFCYVLAYTAHDPSSE